MMIMNGMFNQLGVKKIVIQSKFFEVIQILERELLLWLLFTSTKKGNQWRLKKGNTDVWEAPH